MALLRVLLLFLLACFVAWPAFASCTPTRYVLDGREYIVLSISETSARDTTESVCTGLPSVVTVLSQHWHLSSGTGTTLSPIGGVATAPAVGTYTYRFVSSVTAADVFDMDLATWWLPGGALYVRARPNTTTADNSISADIVLVKGSI